jgi:hypothetical protein
MGQWRAFVNTKVLGSSLSSCTTGGLFRRDQLHDASYLRVHGSRSDGGLLFLRDQVEEVAPSPHLRTETDPNELCLLVFTIPYDGQTSEAR